MTCRATQGKRKHIKTLLASILGGGALSSMRPRETGRAKQRLCPVFAERGTIKGARVPIRVVCSLYAKPNHNRKTKNNPHTPWKAPKHNHANAPAHRILTGKAVTFPPGTERNQYDDPLRPTINQKPPVTRINTRTNWMEGKGGFLLIV